MKKQTKIALAAIGALVVIGAATSDGEPSVPDPTPVAVSSTASPPKAAPKADHASTDWFGYAPEVKARIDRLATARDCAGLQKEFDLADANADRQRERGANPAEVMAYIDDAMKDSGCY